MNDLSAIIEFINSCGFPIACVIALFYMTNKEREAHAAETANLTSALNDLRLVIQRVLDRLDMEDEQA